MTKFFTFDQNNSGGSFRRDEKSGIGRYVIIEAYDATHANARAEDLGIYFDGCSDGFDCSCCGDRWHRAYDSDGEEFPEVYGNDVRKDGAYYNDWCWQENEVCVFVHNLDGTIESYEERKKVK